MILADGHLIARSRSKIKLIEATPSGFTQKSVFEAEPAYEKGTINYMRGCVMPVLSRGRLLLRTMKGLSCYNVSRSSRGAGTSSLKLS